MLIGALCSVCILLTLLWLEPELLPFDSLPELQRIGSLFTLFAGVGSITAVFFCFFEIGLSIIESRRKSFLVKPIRLSSSQWHFYPFIALISMIMRALTYG